MHYLIILLCAGYYFDIYSFDMFAFPVEEDDEAITVEDRLDNEDSNFNQVQALSGSLLFSYNLSSHLIHHPTGDLSYLVTTRCNH